MAAAEIQALLRFLTQDAKIPLAEAMSKIGALRKQGLNTANTIAQADSNKVKDIFVDEKLVKQVLNAAKRVSNPKKRKISQAGELQVKRFKLDDQNHARDLEAELALPTTDMSIEELTELHIETNRAPLVLAFAIVTLEFTMPEQPLSSRLSLAHAVVSANSQTKAKSIGLVSGTTAEDEGWSRGQPRVKVMNREIAVMRRQMYPPADVGDSQDTVEAEDIPSHEAFWGLDIEALKKSNGPLTTGKLVGSQGPPIHKPQAARSYLLKSISPVETDADTIGSMQGPKKKTSAAEIIAAKQRVVAALLQAIRLLCGSWSSTLSASDLDSRAWSWYLTVRPDVAQGQSGWGQRGMVRLADIMKLRKSS